MSFTEYLKENEEILIPGFGRLTREQLPESIMRRLQDVMQRAEKGSWHNVYGLLYKDGVIESMLKVADEIKRAEMESPLDDAPENIEVLDDEF